MTALGRFPDRALGWLWTCSSRVFLAFIFRERVACVNLKAPSCCVWKCSTTRSCDRSGCLSMNAKTVSQSFKVRFARGQIAVGTADVTGPSLWVWRCLGFRAYGAGFGCGLQTDRVGGIGVVGSGEYYVANTILLWFILLISSGIDHRQHSVPPSSTPYPCPPLKNHCFILYKCSGRIKQYMIQ